MKFRFDNDRPIYVQLVEQLELMIVAGEYELGERLPSVRELAVVAKVNPNTMQKSLVELEEAGLIFTERTNGKFVTQNAAVINRRRDKYKKALAKSYLKNMEALGFDKKEAIKALGG